MDTAKLRELLDKREEIDKQIVELVLQPKKDRAPQKCGKCGQEGHSSRTCGKVE